MKYLIIILSVLSFGFCGCEKIGNCAGADVIYTIEGISVFANDTVKYVKTDYYNPFLLRIEVGDSVNSRKGTRNCFRKDMKLKYENEWDKNTLSLKCDKELFSGKVKYPANSELISSKIVKYKFDIMPWGTMGYGTYISISDIDSIPKSDNYTFTISAKTNKEEIFTAEKIVHIKE